MGKRKRTATSFPSDFIPCSSGRELTPGENYSDPDNFGIFNPHPAVKETMDSHGKHSNSQISLGQHHYNLSRSIFMKRSRHHYSNQYSRRNSPNYNKASTSFGKSSPFNDERFCFKLDGKYNSELAHRPGPDFTEFQKRAFCRPERIKTSTSVIDAISQDGAKRVCGLCQKSLRRKPPHCGSTLSLEELSIVAVLVCGHIYHADCLEEKTSLEDKRDPPCPTCTDFTPKLDLAKFPSQDVDH